MTKIEIQDLIMNEYKEKGCVFYFTLYGDYCYPKVKEIYININEFLNPNSDTIFDILHEIGHLETNTTKMRRCEEEYYATVWALEHMADYGIKVSKKRLREYQNYIDGLYHQAVKRNAKNIKDLSFYKLAV